MRDLLKQYQCGELGYGDDRIKKALVTVTIEKILLDMGKTVYDKVIEKLNKNYNCYLTDCYENPEYLSKLLNELFGNASRSITKSIAEHLTEFETKESISRFVKVINH
ncbi:MAG: hypothetical protein AUI62_03690 [Thaumarchaeota archaeon 13_1_40CM_2_39_7]|nr:MAG: hypothetical protein AUI62_03690 [Thaumarchaeota archaeon 13_1_40CM_2_39_7]